MSPFIASATHGCSAPYRGSSSNAAAAARFVGSLKATDPKLAAVTTLTLLPLCTGVVLADLSGGLGMARTMESIPMPHAGDLQ